MAFLYYAHIWISTMYTHSSALGSKRGSGDRAAGLMKSGRADDPRATALRIALTRLTARLRFPQAITLDRTPPWKSF